MPCNSDYMNPTDKETRLRETAWLYAYALSKLGEEVPPEVGLAAENIYCRKDYVPALCALLKGLPEEKRDAIVYNARDKDARRLADWWEEHLEADRIREAKEAKEAATIRKGDTVEAVVDRADYKKGDRATVLAIGMIESEEYVNLELAGGKRVGPVLADSWKKVQK